jgi:hypothetical protein
VTDGYERGEPDEFEVVWKSGHVDRLKAHQVTWPSNTFDLFGGQQGPARVLFHGEVDGRWRLLLSALEDDIRSVRNITHVEDRP